MKRLLLLSILILYGCSKDADSSGSKFRDLHSSVYWASQAGESVDQSGCGYSQLDDDADGVANGIDQCPNSNGGYLSLFGVEFDNNGCKIDYAYLDENGVTVKAYPDSPVGKVTYINHPLF